jgi:hypothetical protein
MPLKEIYIEANETNIETNKVYTDINKLNIERYNKA